MNALLFTHFFLCIITYHFDSIRSLSFCLCVFAFFFFFYHSSTLNFYLRLTCNRGLTAGLTFKYSTLTITHTQIDICCVVSVTGGRLSGKPLTSTFCYFQPQSRWAQHRHKMWLAFPTSICPQTPIKGAREMGRHLTQCNFFYPSSLLTCHSSIFLPISLPLCLSNPAQRQTDREEKGKKQKNNS